MWVALLLVATGCGGSRKDVVVADFRPGDEEVFDDAIDLVASPAIVQGEWGGDFERRVDRADLIAVVKIETLRSNVDLDRRTTYRLSAAVRETFKGRTVRELALQVGDHQGGFDTVRVNEDRLLREPFVAFVKWQDGSAPSEVRARWHLSPASLGVREKVAFLLSGSTRSEDGVVIP